MLDSRSELVKIDNMLKENLIELLCKNENTNETYSIFITCPLVYNYVTVHDKYSTPIRIRSGAISFPEETDLRQLKRELMDVRLCKLDGEFCAISIESGALLRDNLIFHIYSNPHDMILHTYIDLCYLYMSILSQYRTKMNQGAEPEIQVERLLGQRIPINMLEILCNAYRFNASSKMMPELLTSFNINFLLNVEEDKRQSLSHAIKKLYVMYVNVIPLYFGLTGYVPEDKHVEYIAAFKESARNVTSMHDILIGNHERVDNPRYTYDENNEDNRYYKVLRFFDKQSKYFLDKNIDIF